MKEANPRAHVTRLIAECNYVGAYLSAKDDSFDALEQKELVGAIAASVVDELSKTRRDDRERVLYLRSVLAWVFRDVPGLSALYREQLREARGGGGGDFLGPLVRGMQNVGDVATGRKSVQEGLQDAADEARRGVEETAESLRSSEPGAKAAEFLSFAEQRIRQGLDQLGAFFRTMNDGARSGEPAAGQDQAAGEQSKTDAVRESAARADAGRDVEDAEYEPIDAGKASDEARIRVDRENGPRSEKPDAL